MNPWVLTLIAAAIVGITAEVMLRCNRRAEHWSVKADGALKRLEYTNNTTTLYFEAGTVLYGVPGILPMPKTILVQLMKSDRGRYRLEPYGDKDMNDD